MISVIAEFGKYYCVFKAVLLFPSAFIKDMLCVNDLFVFDVCLRCVLLCRDV